MNRICISFLTLFLFFPLFLSAQDDGLSLLTENPEKPSVFYGFVRGGLYGTMDKNDDKPYVSSAFSDFGLKAEIKDNIRFKAFADIRFRYGTEFLEPVKNINLREAYVKVNGKFWDITAGQTIVKWGRTDFSNPTSKLNPQNYISRSPDPEDMDMGNLLAELKIYPAPFFSLQAVAVPYYRPSTLLIDPLPLPGWIKINQLPALLTSRDMFSYGLKAEFRLSGTDMSLSWFNGYDPMPGAALTAFSLDMSGSFPSPSAEISMTPYKIQNFGIDFENTIGSFGVRGEGSWSVPYKSHKTAEYVPLEEVKYVAGIDWMPGDWRLTAEYSGKTILGFEAPAVEPLIGAELDMAKLSALLADPGFVLDDYVRQQVSSFNRLYNYQMEKTYHSAGLRIERELFYGKVVPSVFALYNFTSRDLLLMPEIRYKPADGLTISAGGDIYSGKKGSVHDLVNDFMNCIRIAVRVDF
ncbi:MAG TPA: hypothetical protein PLM01_11350 [Bacteroidales bacterium]|jgi:hypothetical protein|nr:hypothetical protein [Bacteroidales bacterium]HQJ83091.1 hypothetical protein [Bacteroidales bacterium]